MNVAVVIAGGTGSRMKSNIPKQFMCVQNIPIIIYSLINAQRCSKIDEIVAVVPEGWLNFLDKYLIEFRITKFKETVIGGTTRQESTYNAFICLSNYLNDEDVVCLIDANRPLMPIEIIEKMWNLHSSMAAP